MPAEMGMDRIRTIMHLFDCKFPILEGAYFFHIPVASRTNYLSRYPGITVRDPLDKNGHDKALGVARCARETG
jgi:hypothetical protein